MSASNRAVADQASESFPDYSPQIHDTYIEGYDPVSLGAPHSSLERTSTWVGMGILLIALAGVGLIIWTGVSSVWSQGVAASEYNYMMFFWIGIIFSILGVIAGFGLIYRGRRFYRKYRDSTGRKN